MSTKRKHRMFSLLFLSLANLICCYLITGCLTQPAQENIPSNTPPSPVTLSATPISSVLLTSTPLPLQTTSPMESIQTTTPTINLDVYEYASECIKVEPAAKKEISSGGGVILNDPSNSQSKKVYLLDPLKSKITYFGKDLENLSNFAVSPNHQWVAYFVFGTNNPIVVFRNFETGKIIEIPFPFDKKWDKFVGWVNNDQILISLESDTYPPPYVLFNPFTKSEINLPATYPDQQVVSGTTHLPLATYDPTTNKVVYPVFKEGIRELGLYNRLESKQIALFPSLEFVAMAAPKWDYRGEKFAFSLMPPANANTLKYSFEIYISDANGNAKQVTQLNQNISSYYIENLAWSTNDRYLAFVVFDLGHGPKLMFLDTFNKKVIDPCIDLSSRGNPVWSPIGNQLVIMSKNYNEDNVLLIDLDLRTAEILTKGDQLDIYGWIKIKP